MPQQAIARALLSRSNSKVKLDMETLPSARSNVPGAHQDAWMPQAVIAQALPTNWLVEMLLWV